MTASSQTHRDSPYVAELVSAAGGVFMCSLEGALDKLIGALESRSEDAPYGAVVTETDKAPTAAQVWRSCLTAWTRVGSFLESAHIDALHGAHWMSELEWPEDLKLVSPIRHGTAHRTAADIVRLYFEASIPSASKPTEDVFLLLTPDKLEEMLPNRLAGVSVDECVLIHVVGDKEVNSRWYVPSRKPEEPLARAHPDQDPPPDGCTLAWRQWFAKNVKCLTAAQVAEEGGHQAKNTSATASRWTNEGKIFSVRHAGQLLYPAFQFRHGSPLPVVAQILQALGRDHTGWDYAFFLATPNAYLGGERPMDRLHDKKMEQELVRIAERHSHPADIF